MLNCIYNTDPKWAKYLYLKGYKDKINFWRKDRRKIRLNKGVYFYFKIRGTPYIVGRGQFLDMKMMTMKEAWDEFGDRNGAESYEKFVELCKDTLGIEKYDENALINCIILDNVEWLKPEYYYEIDESLFPRNILNGKYFQDDEIEDLINLFQKNNCIQDKIEEDDLDLCADIDSRKYFEGVRKISIHNRIERNRNLINAVKRKRKWNCDICNLNFYEKYGVEYIEAHHKIPLSRLNKQVSNSEADIVLLCPNCHRAVHEYMRKYTGWEYEYIRKEISSKIYADESS